MTEPTGTGVARRHGLLLRYLHDSQTGGWLLMAAAAIALLWANSPFAHGYFAFWEMPLPLAAIGLHTPHAVVNDALMTLFFLLATLEIRRELTSGELAGRARAAGPVIAAIGGMVVPVLCFLLVAGPDPTVLRGWAIPAATDIAFSLAVLRLLGRRVPLAARIFLTALAIIDDLGAIVIIALFYAANVQPLDLGLAAGLWLVLRLIGRIGFLRGNLGGALYLLGGVGLWWWLLQGGVHPSLAGVALAFALPGDGPAGQDGSGKPSLAARMEHGLMPLVSVLVLPAFGLANAGLALDGLPAHPWDLPLVRGVVLGLVVGKPVGVFGATWLARRARLMRLPGPLTTLQMAGISLLCGIGFTMSLFITDLAYRSGVRVAEARLAVLVGSLVSAVLGLAVMALAARRGAPTASAPRVADDKPAPTGD